MANKELAERALKALEANPQEWEQGTWRCGTRMCYAGFVAQAAGATWNNASDPDDDYVKTPEGRVFPVYLYAVQQLDPDREGYAARLFHGNNSLEDIQEIIHNMPDD